jgi:predicted nucleotidyltransferase
MKYGLPEHVLQKIRAVFARYPQVTKAILYGSRAEGSHKNGSDIDLTLCGGADLTLSTLHRIADDLDDLLLPYTFDLSIFHHISDPDVLGHIERVGVTLYEKEPRVTDRAFDGLRRDG